MKGVSGMNTKLKYTTMTAIWIINPVYVGGCYAPTFNFDGQDMVELMETVNEQFWTVENDEGSYELEFQLTQVVGETEIIDEDNGEQFNILGSADACGQRSFFAEASACLEVSTLYIEGTVTITDLETDTVIIDSIPLEGTMDVLGYELTSADMYLSSGEDVSINFSSSDGESFSLNQAQWTMAE